MPEDQECRELVCDICDLPVYDFSLVNYPLYTNSEISFFLPCPIGMVCTDAEGNVIEGTTVTVPAGVMTFRPTTEAQNSQEAAQAAMTEQAQQQASNGQIPGGGGSGGGGGPGGGGSPGLNPKPKLYFNDEVDTSCPDGSIGSNPGLNFFVGPGHVIIPAGVFSSSTSKAAATNRATAEAVALLDYSGCHWENTEQSYTANCSDGKFGEPVTKTKAAGLYSSVVSQADADQKAKDAAQEEAEAELVCYDFTNTEQTATCPEGYTGDPVTVAAGEYFSNISQANADSLALAAAEAMLSCVPECVTDKINSLTWIHTGGGTGSGTGGTGSIHADGASSQSDLDSNTIFNDCGSDQTINFSIPWSFNSRVVSSTNGQPRITVSVNSVLLATEFRNTTETFCQSWSGTLTANYLWANGAPLQIRIAAIEVVNSGCGGVDATFTITGV